MSYFRRSKRGFTLIELMVVVVIIGILALLGLRLYLTQIAKSNDALIKANAGTVQTTIQAGLADTIPTLVWADWVSGALITASGIHNPMTKLLQDITSTPVAIGGTDAEAGEVWVYYDPDPSTTDFTFYINGMNHDGTANVYTTTDLVAKY